MRSSRSVSSSIASSSDATDPRPRSRNKLSRSDRANVDKLNADLLEVMRSRPELSEFTDAHAKESDATLYRFGRNALDAAKHSKAPNRQHFLDDVRKEHGFRPLSFIYDLFEVYPPS